MRICWVGANAAHALAAPWVHCLFDWTADASVDANAMAESAKVRLVTCSNFMVVFPRMRPIQGR